MKSLAQTGISSYLSEHKGDFDQDAFEKLLTQDKDLSHVLYSDVLGLYQKIV